MNENLTISEIVELLNELDGCGIIFTDEELVRETLADWGYEAGKPAPVDEDA